jgi:hypothetical protein
MRIFSRLYSLYYLGLGNKVTGISPRDAGPYCRESRSWYAMVSRLLTADYPGRYRAQSLVAGSEYSCSDLVTVWSFGASKIGVSLLPFIHTPLYLPEHTLEFHRLS